MIEVHDLSYRLPSRRLLLDALTFSIPQGAFLAVLGENGAGKTTLLDILMGFRRRTAGRLSVMQADPSTDPWRTRERIAYLSEKVDMPGDWEAREYLDFHRPFYPHYDRADERRLMDAFGMSYDNRVGNLSAGEIRRLQIVAALATQPRLVIADEITAVLDIRGRMKFLDVLRDLKARDGLTVILATNVPEGLDPYVDQVLLIHKGRQIAQAPLAEFLDDEPALSDAVLRKLQTT